MIGERTAVANAVPDSAMGATLSEEESVVHSFEEKSAVKIRSMFPESWLWDMISVGCVPHLLMTSGLNVC